MTAPFCQSAQLTPDCLGGLQAAVRNWLAQAAIAPPQAFAVAFVIEELVANLQHHAAPHCPHPIHLELALELQDNGLLLRLVDDGPAFQPSTAPPPHLDRPLEQRPIGGLGWFLCSNLAEFHRYQRHGQRNCNEFRFPSGPDPIPVSPAEAVCPGIGTV